MRTLKAHRVSINLAMKAVKQFPYRSALAKNVFVTINGLRDEANERPIDALHQQLAADLDVAYGNHEVYEVETSDRGTLYAEFTDFNLHIGTEVVQRDW